MLKVMSSNSWPDIARVNSASSDSSFGGLASEISFVRSVSWDGYETQPLQPLQPKNYGTDGSNQHVVNVSENSNNTDSLASNQNVVGSYTIVNIGQDETLDVNCFYNYFNPKNLGLSLGRNMFSVGIPTASREYLRRAVLPSTSAATLTYMGVAACGLPVALEMIKLIRECCNCDNASTKESLVARIANMSFVSASAIGLACSGGFLTAAPALIAATFCYVPMRDAIQYFVRLSDNNRGGIEASPTLKTAACYIANQTAVDQLMTALSDVLTPYLGGVAANVLGRAIANVAGECTDDMTYAIFNAISKENKNLNFSLTLRPKDQMTSESIINQVFTTVVARASLFTTSFASAYAVPFSGVAASLFGGAVLGVGYVPFIYAHHTATKDQIIEGQLEEVITDVSSGGERENQIEEGRLEEVIIEVSPVVNHDRMIEDTRL
ncbi:hypothetical protein [Plesiomonas sp.]|uniref:hypothetical protein n=1 Tax=Plesiomonas sp. TaxID=2486279 RepID=UPI003F359EB1